MAALIGCIIIGPAFAAKLHVATWGTDNDGMTLLSTGTVAKIKDKVLEADGTDDGLKIGDSESSLIQGNIAAFNANMGFELNQQDVGIKDYTVKNNLALDNAEDGITLDIHVNRGVRFDGNHSLQNGDAAVLLSSGTNVLSFRNNDTYGSGSQSGDGKGIENGSGNDMTYKKHFFGNASGPDNAIDNDRHDGIVTGGDMVTGSDASKMNAFKAKKAASL